jgi:hypothetical protein
MSHRNKFFLLGFVAVSVIFLQIFVNDEATITTSDTTLPAEAEVYKTPIVQATPTILKTPDISFATSQTQTVQAMRHESKPVSFNPIDRIKAIQQKTALHDSLLKDHDSFTRYPEYNQTFSSVEKDPTIQRYEIDERTTENDEGDSSLTIWSDKKYYLHGDQATIYATLQDAHGLKIPTSFMGQIIFNETNSLQQIELLDLDKDGVYEYHIKLDQINSKALDAGLYKVLIVNNTNELADAVTFTLSEPKLKLTGEYIDSISAQGSLVIRAEVEATEKSRFYFQASLYSSTNDPIGSTQYALELEPGKHWIPLEFDGLMIRDAGEPGPFLLKTISLAKVALPIQRAPLIYPKFYTQDYSVDQFRNTNYAAMDAH